jgi:hypothetical protein
MVFSIERETSLILWRQQKGSTFQKQRAREAAIEARIAAQRQARLASRASCSEVRSESDLVRNARIAARYGD